jgi:glycosyltransferase involved in cell wall biosynthesis
MSRKLLMIAFHFPPAQGSSGIQRTLRFVRHLPAHGWEPVVLTVTPRAHPRTSADLSGEVPGTTEVIRAQGWDTSRHFALAGRYPAFLARPDRWQSWRFDAVRQGLARIRRGDIDAIWSTYPIATAHVIGAALQARSGLPWIADFRDPMAQDGYPADPRTRAQFLDIEAQAMRQAARCVFTTPGAAALYAQRYPAAAGERLAVIENGYDESTFAAADRLATPPAQSGGPLTLLHSGIVYESERDPRALLQALALLRQREGIDASALKLRFRASQNDALLARLAAEAGVQDQIELAPAVGYREALAEMLGADGLLVMQASNCNAQIPAKVYEYLRAGRPVLPLTDPVGDTAGVLRGAGVSALARLDDPADIAGLLVRFLRHREDPAFRPDPQAARRTSREARTVELAAMLERVVPARRA